MTHSGSADPTLTRAHGLPPLPDTGTLAMILAGGQGERLYPLTRVRAKPAVSFAGLYRIIDFTLSNCLNSGLTRIYVLTQHESLSLDRHVRGAWSLLHPERGECVQTVPPQRHLVTRWYAGTADAVFQNLHVLDAERPRHVVVLSGDHVYRMDYRPFIAAHVARDADVTIACAEVPCAEATRMGVLGVDESGRVVVFDEKPAHPMPLPGRPTHALVSMGVYVFRTEAMVRALVADAKRVSEHDFGRSVLPAMLDAGAALYAFDLEDHVPPGRRYWQDVGTLDAYYEVTMDLLRDAPPFALDDVEWPLRTALAQHPPAMVRAAGGRSGNVRDTILAPGAVVEGAGVARSVLGPRVRLGPGAEVSDSILLPGVQVGSGAVVRRAILDENVLVPPDARIGCVEADDRRRFDLTPQGVVVIAEGALFR